MIRALSFVGAVLAGLAAGAGAAHAGPAFLAVLAGGGGLGAAFAATTVGAFAATTVGRLLISVAVSALSRARQPTARDPGLQTRTTQLGGVNPLSTVFGVYATAGSAVCPPMSHGANNAFLTYVVDVADTPVDGLQGLFVDGERVVFGSTPDADGFLPFLGRLAGFGRIKFLNGNQTTADPWLLATYGSYPERPWAAGMIGRGVAYAILNFTYDRERYQGLPSVRFEVRGMPLYDPRLDTTAGGSGAQRFNNPATWAFSSNPVVMIYNILRGITLLDGSTWGGSATATDLPASVWFAAMNECDVAIPMQAGTTQPQYRAGFEFTFEDEPASVIEELLKTCNGALFEAGGAWKIRVGPPALPVYFFDDGDVLTSRPQDLEPFPGLDQTINAIHARYPEPDQLWEAKDAPPVYDPALEAADGGRRLVADLSMPAAPYGAQVQRLMRALQRDHRRMIRHAISLPPEASVLEPMDTVAWTSAANGYTAKQFEVGEVTDEPLTMIQSVSLREVDPSDYEWSTEFELPLGLTSTTVVSPAALTVPGFAVVPFSFADGQSILRRPGLRLSWDGSSLSAAQGLAYEIRVTATGQIAAQGSTLRVQDGEVIVGDILPQTEYQVRMRVVSDLASDWTAWLDVTSPTHFILARDIAEDEISRRFGYPWTVLPSPITLTPAAPTGSLLGSIQTGTFGNMRGDLVAVGIEATLTAAAPRAVRIREGSGKSTRLDQIQWLLPGTTMRVVATGAVSDLVAGTSTISLSPEVEAIGLLTGESIVIVDGRCEINYRSR
jgi:hypothetical protein